MKIALISLEQAWEDKPRNLARVEALAAEAAVLGAEVVIFPEMTLTGFTMNTAAYAEEPQRSASAAAFAAIARRHAVWVVAGAVLRNGIKASNMLLAFASDGVEAVRYAKMHPFSHGRENEFFLAGDALAKVSIKEFRLGFTICYDLRFPELYSALGKDCDVLVNIACWPKRRVAHWRTLLQARAIENQCYVVGVNRTGVDGNGLDYERSSGVVMPNGEFAVPTATAGEIDIHELQTSFLHDYRQSFATRPDRRPQIYREII